MKTTKDPRWFEKLSLPMRLRVELEAAATKKEGEEALRAKQLEQEEQAIYEAKLLEKKDVSQAAVAVDHGAALKIVQLPFGLSLFDEDALRAAYRKIKVVASADRDRTKNRVALIEHIAARGSKRMKHVDADWRALATLRSSFVNFGEVLDLIEAELTLADDPVNVMLPPLLLNGAPGCGKTFFAQKLADFFGTGFLRVSLETSQNSAELVGTAEHWSNTQPGRLFDKLIDGDHINPVVLIDEVDKSGGHDAYRADKALYALLERESAKQWCDASFPALKLDASHVIWVLTANDASLIPAPLRSRMRQFDIPTLSAHAARQLVRTLYRQEIERHPRHDLEPELAIAHCDVLRLYSPRELVRLCHALVACVVLAGRREVTLDDLKKTGALDGRLVDFERFVSDVERRTGRTREWTRQ